MPVRKDTIFEQYLAPVVRFFINEEELRRFADSIDWQAESDRFRNPNLTYPVYYTQHFHSIEGGYLNISAAVTYDPITQYVLPPNETWVRQSLIDSIQVQPSRILDLGCGTGSTTLMLKQTFPNADVMGIDLSPYMLVVAEHKAKQAHLNIDWQHHTAEATPFAPASFDLITASLLFHELPPDRAQAVLEECFRLLKPGGEVLMLDGNQKTLRQSEWLTQIFEEPYIQAYAQGSVDAWMGTAGFRAIQTQEFWWIHQVTRGVKPLPDTELEMVECDRTEAMEQWAIG
ncbi:class I SAM-dependent methyltransferase [Myxacorys almedinensis]|uniref:Methyltransferase domain-containing protein n=1 Tax=Myxacorys almedinensis A TaxID=2690445 RepID=A0A8J7YZ74_9CYAN|nr:class I SAM-dependent methyltransferase [Myxacorys almedinensis]NDJ17292.1 methyltransferase domain-containing protein [Myxacorys almedinensis A]